ncbi:uncharacterized protein METZ01_LOCUS199062 [marine metagenome]|uniref:Uncharacterized protein n=1 Tax=marine metagenome TaxID=408172 RepID=A0A382E680_9ZZZZ
MRQQNDIVELEEFRVDCRFVLVNVETGAGDASSLQQRSERGLINSMATRCIDDIAGWADEFEPARR